MDMSLREWLVLIGLIIIAIVLIDGYRRMFLAKKRASELHFGLEEVKSHPEYFCSGELPNGGARRQNSVVDNDSQSDFAEDKPHNNRVEPSLSISNFDNPGKTHVPPATSILSECINTKDTEHSVSMGKEGLTVNVLKDSTPAATNASISVHAGLDGAGDKHKRTKRGRILNNMEDTSENISAVGQSKLDDRLNKYKSKKPVKQESKRESAEKLSDRPPSEEVIIVNVVAKGVHSFDGERLLNAVLSSGLRFGDMSIFHRYTNDNGTGKILFSMANGIEPGTFNIDKINGTSTPAVSFFMGLPGAQEQLKAFTKMVEVAKQLALNLGGELKDEQYSVMTQQTIEHCRQRIIDFERKQLAHRVPN